MPTPRTPGQFTALAAALGRLVGHAQRSVGDDTVSLTVSIHWPHAGPGGDMLLEVTASERGMHSVQYFGNTLAEAVAAMNADLTVRGR